MPSITPNLRLSITNRETNKPFLNWRLGIDGPDDSNMIKLDRAWGDMKTMVDGAMAAVGHAYTAATVADMTDHDKSYVYVGSETGYTNGNWYYWNEDQSAWVSGGVYNATALQTDDTLKLEGEAADAKATGEMIVINGDSSNGTRINITTTDEDIEIPTMEDVDELKNAMDDVFAGYAMETVGSDQVATLLERHYFATQTDVGSVKFSLSNNYKTFYFTAPRGGKLKLNFSASSKHVVIAKGMGSFPSDTSSTFSVNCTSYTDYPSADIPETAISIAAGDFVGVSVNNSGSVSFETDLFSTERKIDPDFLNQTTENAESKTAADLYAGFQKKITWESGTFGQTVGSTSSNVSNSARQRMVSPAVYDTAVSISSDGTFKYNVTFFDSDMHVAKNTGYIATATVRVPPNTYFRVVIEDGTDATTNISSYTSDNINQHITISARQFADLIQPGVNWIAMGDSITEGWRSEYTSDDQSETTTMNNGFLTWAIQVADANNWNLTNIAVGGTGFLNKVNGAEAGDYTSCGFYKARHTDFSPYNLVTVAYGINDWKANMTMGTIDDDGSAETPTTVLQAMKATIEGIMASNPACKIIVLLPLNARGYTSTQFGNKANQYARGYTGFANMGTLDSFANKMIEVCNLYGVQYIDMTRYSVLNTENMEALLPDGVHPSLEGHRLLANELSKKITF